MRMKIDKKEKEKQKKVQDARQRDKPWEVALSPVDSGAELAERQCCKPASDEKHNFVFDPNTNNSPPGVDPESCRAS